MFSVFTMQETLLDEDFVKMDLSNVAALQQKRTLAFVNHFVISTVQFLNNFTKSCEQKLMQFERKLEKVNATMVLLEAKLSSIPEVNIQTQTTESKETETAQKLKPAEADQPNTCTHTASPTEKLEHQNEDTESVKSEFEKFIKMVQVGVPLDAVKLKISLEGLDPQEFDRILKKQS